MKFVRQRVAALVFCLFVITTSTPLLPAQQTESKKTGSKSRVQTNEATKPKQSVINGNIQKLKKRHFSNSPKAKKAKALSKLSNPISVINGTTNSEVLTGQTRVVVKGNQDPIIRLGLARNGSTVVEFPALDNFFAVHPGSSSNIVTVDESLNLATDHFLVFRAGKDFVSPLPNSKQRDEAKATVSVQMESGMFVTLMFYPVSDVTQMAHRCVVVYSREEVVNARRRAGLAVNLNEKVLQEDAKQTLSKPLNKDQSAEKDKSEISKQADDKNSSLILKTKEILQSVVTTPTKFTGWSKPLHGLSISTLMPVEIDENHCLVIIAVKNTTAKSLRLIEGEPSIDVLMLNEKGKPVLIQSLAKLHVETTAVESSVPANSIVYFAFVFKPPILSVNQRVRLSVANREAADEPVTTLLPR